MRTVLAGVPSFWMAALIVTPHVGHAQDIAIPEPLLIEDPAGRWVDPIDINEAGLVIGLFTTRERATPFSWSKDTGFVELALPMPVAFAVAWGLNDCGEIVGEAEVPDAEGGHAVLWHATGEIEDLGTLGGAASRASDINNRGAIVGSSQTTEPGNGEAFIWTRAEGMRSLGTLGGVSSHARAVNERDEVVGVSDTADGSYHGFYWSHATGMLDLGTLERSASDAFAIDDRGLVVGLAGGGLVERGRAFLWSRRRGFQVFAGDTDPIAFARRINRYGWMVGESVHEFEDEEEAMQFGSQYRHARLWLGPDRVVDLHPGYGISSFAFGVNDRKQVIGSVSFTNGNDSAGLLWEFDAGNRGSAAAPPLCCHR